MPKAEKVATVAEITDRFRSSSAAVVTEYRGLTMAQLTELRTHSATLEDVFVSLTGRRLRDE